MTDTSAEYELRQMYAPPPGLRPVARPRPHAHSSPVDDVPIRRRSERSNRRRMHRQVFRFTDTAVACILVVALTMPGVITLSSVPALLEREVAVQSVVGGLLFAAIWSVTFTLFGSYDHRLHVGARQEVNAVVAAVLTAALLSIGASIVLPFPMPGAADLLRAMPWLIALTLAARWSVRVSLAMFRPRATPSVLIVGSGPRALRTYHEMCHGEESRCQLVGFLDDVSVPVHPEIRQRLVGGLDDLGQVLMRAAVDEVVIALPVKSCYTRIQRAIDVCEGMGVQSRFPADVFRCDRTEPQLRVEEHAIALRVPWDTRLLVKRGIDILGAAAGLAFLLPLLVLIAVVVRLNSPGPALFVQRRYGHRKRAFMMYKFRTMVANAEALQKDLEGRNEAVGPVFKIRRDPRVTRFGYWLRKSSLDELPQLWNVLVGDMSLVGPRPLSVRDVHGFTEPWLMRRFSVRPGMTGLWQVSGRSNLAFDAWVSLDLSYIDHWSLSLDSRILAKTIPAVLRGTGAT